MDNRRLLLTKKIKGMFLGIAIGDALGMPYEKLTSSEVMALTDGNVSLYADPNEKHFLKGVLKAGDITDDTQLTLAVTESLIDKKGFDLVNQGQHHIRAMEQSTCGWGKGTTSAIERVRDGTSPFASGTPDGAGNGVAMKISPLGALMAIMFYVDGGDRRRETFMESSFDLGMMTHRSAMALASGWVQARLVRYCFFNFPNHQYFKESFLCEAITACAEGESFNRGMDKIEDRLVDRLVGMLYGQTYLKSVSELADMYGKKPFYVYDSLPLAYNCFLKNPTSIEALYSAIRAGGDTDTNASMVGALLGALNGDDVFPEHLLTGLNDYEGIMKTVYRFCDAFLGARTLDM